MNRLTDRILGFFLISVALFLTGIMVWKNWSAFLNICPIKDLLTWDENIRLNQLLDQYQDFREGRYWRGFFPFLEASTWPPLRSIFSLFMLWGPGEWPITWKDSFLGLIFYALCFPTLIYTSFRITGSFIFSGAVSLLILAMSLHTTETPAYSLSSMLETQGMFVLLWVYFALYKLYDSVQKLGPGAELEKGNRVSSLVSVALLSLFFTKYPYGLLLFISLFLYEGIARLPELIGFLRFAIRVHYKNLRLIFLVSVVGLVFSLPILRVVTDWNLDQRSFKKVLYFLTVILFLDFNYFLFKYRNEAKKITPPSLRVLYIYAILPSFVWLFANLDRVMSLVNAQMIVNKFVRSFILSLFESPSDRIPASHVFDDPWIFRIFFAGSIILIAVWFYLRSRDKNADAKSAYTPSLLQSPEGKLDSLLARLEGLSWPAALRDPLFAISAVVFLQYIVIDVTTGNKQLRHVFYPLPALLWILSLWFFRAIKDSKKWQSQVAISLLSGIIFSWGISLFFRPGGLLNVSYYQSHAFCLKGFEEQVFQPARDFASKIDSEGKYIAFNAFHEEENFQTPGRLLASEFDLLFRLKTLDKGKYRNDNKYRWKTWEEFDKLIYVGPNCELPDKYKIRTESLGYAIDPLAEYSEGKEQYCMRIFRLIRR
ncbi:hypothetical protein BES34_010090 [Leptospira inadai serovar Lyme]|uniref:Dolichyl-phosphate-mannose-protein mannosyltransferase n=2 Tax=Leptospira inadai serovar Lyme TaxID=293084 RepID=A0ABX4YIX6_9LEPT|nr:hypothetical protein [Leptospira inadai]PNV75222.1 hypothetical protein BES34_010090 [Leptospira inadai serovar Lyme]